MPRNKDHVVDFVRFAKKFCSDEIAPHHREFIGAITKNQPQHRRIVCRPLNGLRKKEQNAKKKGIQSDR